MSEHVEELEPEVEELLRGIVPDFPNHCAGATDDEIERIERIADRPLPRFYRWFLMRMGGSMGPFRYSTLDFSAAKVVSCYADGLFVPDSRFLMIGYESDESMPLHVAYDFAFIERDDARVVARHLIEGEANVLAETFREMIAWGAFSEHRVAKLAEHCEGSFFDDDGDVLAKLTPIMESLGFRRLIPSGKCCAMYDRADAAMVAICEPGDEPETVQTVQSFELAGESAGSLRRILGAISDNAPLEVEVDEWNSR